MKKRAKCMDGYETQACRCKPRELRGAWIRKILCACMHADVKWMRFRSCVGRVGQGEILLHRFCCNELTVVWRAHELPRAVTALEPIHKVVPWQIIRPSQSCAGFAPVKCLVSVGGHQFLVICAVPEGRPNGRRPTFVEPSLVMFAAYCRLQQLESEYEMLKENDPAELQKVVNLTQVRTDTLRATPPSLYFLFIYAPHQCLVSWCVLSDGAEGCRR